MCPISARRCGGSRDRSRRWRVSSPRKTRPRCLVTLPLTPAMPARRMRRSRGRQRAMLELLLCSLLTIFPDYLYRRYRQGKRIGREITLYSVWFELRFGIITCLMLTVALITLIFYFHPSTSSATLFYRTVAIVPETLGPASDVNVH